MHSVNSIIPGVKLEILSQKGNDILLNLQHSGLFKAIVIERSGKSVLLDTPAGKISAKAPDNLQKGDAIMARILPAKSEPAIKVEQHIQSITSLPRRSLSSLNRLNISLPAVARVVSQQGHSTQLQIADQSIRIPRMDTLQSGQRVLLQVNSQHKLVLKLLNPESILKTALSTLLPKSLNNSSSHSLSSLQKLSFEILAANTQQLQNRALVQSASSTARTDTQHSVNQQSAVTTHTRHGLEPGTPSVEKITLLLEQLASPVAQIRGIKPQSIQQILVLLSLLKPTATQHSTGNIKSLPETLLKLMNELKASPDSFNRLIRQIFEHSSTNDTQKPLERSLLHIANSLRHELMSQTEQTFNQLLTQKSTVSLQLEQNQPIQLNLSIPIQLKDEVRNLKLKIREKKNQQQLAEQSWEIQLSFQFGLLGLITTSILLQDTRLSANFRVQHQHTRLLIENHMHEFKAQLASSGFELGIFHCQQGQAVEEDETSPLRSGENFVDINV